MFDPGRRVATLIGLTGGIGHQNHRPSSTATLGTTNARITSVSIIRPIPMVVPIWATLSTVLPASAAIVTPNLAAELVRRGWALDYRRFSDGFYSAAEAAARRERRGLWAGTFERLSDWRRKHPRGKAGARPGPP